MNMTLPGFRWGVTSWDQAILFRVFAVGSFQGKNKSSGFGSFGVLWSGCSLSGTESSYLV